MVRNYMKHGPTKAFGLVCSNSSNSRYDAGIAYVPALEDVLVWDVKKGQMLAMWHETGHRAEVTCIERSPQENIFAVGYADGSVRLWDRSSASVITVFDGHKRAVTCLAFDGHGTRLASGSQDTDIIVWDVVAEAGLYRFRGHRNEITSVHFLTPPEGPSTSTGTSSRFLLTSSKDTLLKLWDLSTQHCIQTVVAHRSEIWALTLSPDQHYILTGSGEGELKIWGIDYDKLAGGLQEGDSGEVNKLIHFVSTLSLAFHQRVSDILFHPTQPYLAVQSHDRSIEVFTIRTVEELRKKQARQRKREREKKKERAEEVDNKLSDMTNEGGGGMVEVTLVDLLTSHVIVRASGKVRSLDFGVRGSASRKPDSQIFMALASNALEVFDIPLPTRPGSDKPEASRAYVLNLPGHRTDVRTLCLSSDDQLLASGANGSLKIWNTKTMACIRTMNCGHAICSTFLPGDRDVIVGTKQGEILTYDLATSSLTDTIEAHSASVSSLHIRPDGQALVSGSADKQVKFWEFQWAGSLEDKTGFGKLLHTRTLKMSDDVLSVRYSPNSKLLAVSLLDSTVKIFYQDTLKFFLSLYGHKLPVLSMDISDDSKLIVTCSADKNVKIWGLDFGDCHRSIFAHEESVMQVLFEKKSHCFWTVGKDRMLKYWDGDKFENIQKFDGHHGEIWALAVSHRGNFVVTGSHDKSIRIWEKLDEPLFLEEERERELEDILESGLVESMNRANLITGDDPSSLSAAEVAAVTKQTTETLMAGERIMEALDLADNERIALQEFAEQKARIGTLEAASLVPPPRNPTLAALDLEPEVYVLRVIEKVPSTALHDSLLVLPFAKVASLMHYLDTWAQMGCNITLVSRITFFLLKVHHHQIVANRVMRNTLIPMRVHLRNALRQEKDIVGYNLAALQYVRRKNEADGVARFLQDVIQEDDMRAFIVEGRKRKRVSIKI